MKKCIDCKVYSNKKPCWGIFFFEGDADEWKNLSNWEEEHKKKYGDPYDEIDCYSFIDKDTPDLEFVEHCKNRRKEITQKALENLQGACKNIFEEDDKKHNRTNKAKIIDSTKTNPYANTNSSKYNIIEDLAKEIQNHNTANSDLRLTYRIRCSYSGLGWLSRTNSFWKDKYISDINSKRGYYYSLGLRGCPLVALNINQKADIVLLSLKSKEIEDFPTSYRHFHTVAIRHFSIDLSKEGRIFVIEKEKQIQRVI